MEQKSAENIQQIVSTRKSFFLLQLAFLFTSEAAAPLLLLSDIFVSFHFAVVFRVLSAFPF